MHTFTCFIFNTICKYQNYLETVSYFTGRTETGEHGYYCVPVGQFNYYLFMLKTLFMCIADHRLPIWYFVALYIPLFYTAFLQGCSEGGGEQGAALHCIKIKASKHNIIKTALKSCNQSQQQNSLNFCQKKFQPPLCNNVMH